MIIFVKELRDKSKELALDTSAKLYAYTKTKNMNQTFRVSAVLNETIQPEFLMQAIRMCRKRFPSFYVHFENGFFWKKFKTSVFDTENILFRDTEYCRPMDTEDKNTPLFRILYSDRKISLEVFHGVTDGRGAVTFLKTLLAVYFNLMGDSVLPTNGVLDLNEKTDAEETEDSFVKNYNKKCGFLKRHEETACQYPIENADEKLHVARGSFSVSRLKQITRALNVSVTEYLTAVYIYALYETIGDDCRRKPIKVQVPIDLRPYYNSKTLRNFSLYVNVGIEPHYRNYEFTDILKSVVKQIRIGKDKARLQKMLNANVRDGEMFLSKCLPGIVKTPIIKTGAYLYGERLYTSPMTNLGVIEVPNAMKKHIESFETVIGEVKHNNICAAVVSFDDVITVTFSSKEENNKAAKAFFNILRMFGLDVCDSDAKIIKPFEKAGLRAV